MESNGSWILSPGRTRSSLAIAGLLATLAACATSTGPGSTTAGNGTATSATGSTTGFNGCQVRTLAGNGDAGPVDGSGGPNGSASFDHPGGLALDGFGNLYVADELDNLIRKLDPSGTVTTIAGTGDAGFLNGTAGPGGTAELNLPSAVTLDDAGILYVADSANNRIRKVEGTAVSTLAGNGIFGLVSDAGVAEFAEPSGVAVDGLGSVYVADQFNNCIRKVTSAGAVTTFAGLCDGGPGFVDGNAGTGQLALPAGLALDKLGNLWVADTGNNAIRKIDAQGNLTTVVGNGDAGAQDGPGGPSGSAELAAPSGVAADGQGNLFVADSANNLVRKVDASGNVTTIAGTGAAGFVDGRANTAAFWAPIGIAIDGVGNIYVGDSNNNRIRVISCP